MIEFEKICDLTLYQKDIHEFENTFRGGYLVWEITGGTVRGEKLNGEVYPAGLGFVNEVQDFRHDIVHDQIIKTDDSESIIMNMKLLLDYSREVEETITSGGHVDPSDYYYRGVVEFKTDSSKYKWLEHRICVCDGSIEKWDKLVFGIYMI